jgi:anti-anti-sigma regulatory factor
MILETSELTIYEVEKLQTLFLDELTKKSDFTIDMKNIEKIDMVGIQLLLSLKKSADAQNQQLTFINLNENISHHIALCACNTPLGIAS